MKPRKASERLGEFVLLHRFRIIDFSVVIVVFLGVVYLGLAVDIFANRLPDAPTYMTLEVDELLAASAIFVVGMAWAVARLIRQRRAVAYRIQVEREIRHLAFHDSLTGLANRRRFDDAIREALDALPGADAVHAVFMIDLNGFKRINDIYGHGVGDEVLMHVAKRLSNSMRAQDLVARIGGDEFAILATHVAGPEAATGIAMRVVDTLSAPIRVAGQDHVIGTGIGVALAPQDGTVPDELLRKADIALYRAKAQPESAVRFFEEAMDRQIQERGHLECELRKAIDNGDIEPYFQALVDMKTSRIRGFEVLARWTHPEFGSVEPNRFIPVAEDSGLIWPMTRQLLERALEVARGWPDDLHLSFNLSPVLLRDPGIGLKTLSMLGTAGFSPHRLELEVNESALVRDLDATRAALSGLRDAGVRIALDDFGTGYSSLYHLRNFRVDALKIDRSFIETIATDPESVAIVRALVGLGNGLGLQVVAEGVETEEQRALLAASGCQQLQGFLFSSPVDADGVRALIEQVDDRASLRA